MAAIAFTAVIIDVTAGTSPAVSQQKVDQRTARLTPAILAQICEAITVGVATDANSVLLDAIFIDSGIDARLVAATI